MHHVGSEKGITQKECQSIDPMSILSSDLIIVWMHCLDGLTMNPKRKKFLPRIIRCFRLDLSARQTSTSKSLDAISMVVLITGLRVS